LNFDSDFRMNEVELEQLVRPNLDSRGKNKSKIGRFYDGRRVFVTGATGFVGRLLIEKLLRACVGIERIFVLVRAKRGKSPKERLQQITSSLIFDGVRQSLNKLVAIEGDLTKECYGLSQESLKLLKDEEVSVIFHSAASVNFHEPLRDATLTNLVGAYNAIKLAKELPSLVALVHVSTAYSNCTIHDTPIEERVYRSSMDPTVMIQMSETLDREAMEMIKKHLIGSYPNTYTYTKNLAETLLLNHSTELPIIICRPSVVVCTWREPIQGFVDNINGGNGIQYGPACGISVAMQADENITLDWIPVDLVVNCCIALGWFCAKYHQLRKVNFNVESSESTGRTDDDDDEEERLLANKMKDFYEKQVAVAKAQSDEHQTYLPVFHATSGITKDTLTIGEFSRKMVAYANKYPTLQLYRCPTISYWSSKHMAKIAIFFQNTSIAKLMDFLKKHGLFNPEVYDKNDEVFKKEFGFRCGKIDRFCRTIVYFCTREWDFKINNRLQLYDQFMSPEDRRLFNCDFRRLDWDDYCETYALGIRKFLLKEPIETLERARSRLGLISLRNSIAQLVLVVTMIYFLMLLF